MKSFRLNLGAFGEGVWSHGVERHLLQRHLDVQARTIHLHVNLIRGYISVCCVVVLSC